MARKKKLLDIRAIEGSSCRAVYVSHAGMMHNIEFNFVTENAETVTITMSHDEAVKVIESAIAAYTAIQRPVQFPRVIPFG